MVAESDDLSSSNIREVMFYSSLGGRTNVLSIGSVGNYSSGIKGLYFFQNEKGEMIRFSDVEEEKMCDCGQDYVLSEDILKSIYDVISGKSKYYHVVEDGGYGTYHLEYVFVGDPYSLEHGIPLSLTQ